MTSRSRRPSPWLIAARPRTLPAAVAPVLVGGGLAAGGGAFRTLPFLAALVAALGIQVAANFANDASDAARSADSDDRVGPPRMVASGLVTPRAMWIATWLSVAVAGVAGVYLITVAGWVVAAIGIASLLAMLTYVGGPAPYGYAGLGEAAVFVFFGLVATVGSRYVHDRTAPVDAWVLGAVMGLLAAAILIANNLRDVDSDSRAGKRTLAVILGRERTRRLYGWVVGAAFLLVLIGSVAGLTPPLTGLAIVAAPLAAPLVRAVRTSSRPETLIRVLGGTARLQLVVGAMLAAAASI